MSKLFSALLISTYLFGITPANCLEAVKDIQKAKMSDCHSSEGMSNSVNESIQKDLLDCCDVTHICDQCLIKDVILTNSKKDKKVITDTAKNKLSDYLKTQTSQERGPPQQNLSEHNYLYSVKPIQISKLINLVQTYRL